jgi:DNA-binding cell septation regulator SpoVG
MQITNIRHINKERGKAMVLASFSVDMGPFDMNGFELIEVNGNTFVSCPNRYNEKTNKRFNYVFFKKGEGQALLDKIMDMVLDEMDRREEPEPPRRERSPSRGNPAGYTRRESAPTTRGTSRRPARPQYDDDDDNDMPF